MEALYDLSRCVQHHGAAGHLAGLRRRLVAGTYDLPRYRYLAGKAYVAAGLPLRATALLAGLPGDYRPAAGMEPVDGLRAAALHQHGERRTPLCTLTMIVKDEEKNIAGALDSVDDLVEEIVVCDTGSTDATARIAARYGVTLVSHPWSDDFSAARNAAIDAATGDWILWLDADDRLDPASRAPLLDLIRSAPDRCAMFRIVNQTNGIGANEFMQARLFPRRPDLRFERRIHEQIVAAAQRAKLVFTHHDLIRVIHTGYDDPAAHRLKAQRNRRLIAREVADRPADPSLLQSLGDSCLVTGDIPAALEAYRAAIAIPDAYTINPDVYVQAHFYLALCHIKLGNRREARRYLYRTLFMDPTRIEALGTLGAMCREDGNDAEATTWLLRCLRTAPPVRATATNNAKVQMNAVYALADILLGNGRHADAHAVLDEAIPRFPGVVPFYTMQGRALMGLSRIAEATRCFMKAIALAPSGNPEPYAGVAAIYELLGDRPRSEEFKARALRSRAEADAAPAMAMAAA